MKCSFISDLHIKESGDEASVILDAFFASPEVKNSDRVYLLGDIFDFLVGEHRAYQKEYSNFFLGIKNLISEGKEVIFIEGNHDFHFENTIRKYLKKNPLFSYLSAGVLEEWNGQKVFICHGYEIDYFNKYFKRWFKIYTSTWMKVLLSYIIPFFLLKRLAHSASKDSKRRGKKSFNYDLMKEKYLDGAKMLIREKKLSVIVGGHTHISEFHTYEDGTQYFNVGFPTRDKHFLFYDGDQFKKVPISLN